MAMVVSVYKIPPKRDVGPPIPEAKLLCQLDTPVLPLMGDVIKLKSGAEEELYRVVDRVFGAQAPAIFVPGADRKFALSEVTIIVE
jgi:hypothetical protein